MTWQEYTNESMQHVKFGVEWNETQTATSVTIKPTIWRWDEEWTNNSSSTFRETLSPDTWGDGSWGGLGWDKGKGWRQVDFFNPRVYYKGSSAQTVTLTIATEGSFGTTYGGTWRDYVNQTAKFTITIPKKGSSDTSFSSSTGYSTGKLSYLTLTRKDEVIKAEWKIPEYMTDEDSSRKMNWEDAQLDFVSNGTSVWTEVWKTPSSPGKRTLDYTAADSYWVRGIVEVSPNTELEKPYNRSRYYPATSKKVSSVKMALWAGNGNGIGPKITASYPFRVPQKPAVKFDGWADDSNWRAAYTVESDAGEENNERYDTMYRLFRQDNIPDTGYSKKKALTDWKSTKLEKLEGLQGGPNQIRDLPDGQWCEITLEAYCRGMAGDSAHATASIVASRPARAKITGVKVTSLDNVTGVVNVSVTIPNDAHRWTTMAKLQRLRDVPQDLTANQVAARSGWEDVSGMEQVDDRYKNAVWDTGFTDSVASAAPTGPNLRTWYRVVTENDLYFGDTAYQSTPCEARQLFKAQTAEDDSVFIESIASNSDATAVKLLLGWPNDDSTGTEVSWSVHEDAWESSEQPSTSQVTWSDTPSKGSHANSSSFTIYGLEMGVPVYVRARRYYAGSDGNVESYGPYATASQDSYPFVPSMPPTDVKLTAPTYIPRGQDVALTWTFQSESPQTAWAAYLVSGEQVTPLASGDDALGACTVPYAKFGGADSAQVRVGMTTGGEWAMSDTATVNFADPPVITAALPSVGAEGEMPIILEQPVHVYCSSDTGDDILRIRVISEGITLSKPDGDANQLEGDVVFDAYTAPAWGVADDGLSYCSAELPDHLELHDTGIYRFEITAVNQTTGLASEAEPLRARVRWAHQAHRPASADVVVDRTERTATVVPEKPDNSEPTDVYDLYRMTPDGVFEIATGVSFGESATDRYAPYGTDSLAYRVCTRTVDGDLSWDDFGYELPCRDMRIDWGDGAFVELPYNIVREDSWSKDFEERAHLDGSRSGSWNAGSSRSASLSTDLIRLGSAREQEAVRALARWAGPAFVRLPNGCAYQANVDVSGMSESYNSGAVPVSLSATQVSLTDEFKVAIGDISYTGAGGEEAVPTRSEVAYWGSEQPEPGDAYELMAKPGSLTLKLSTSYDRYTNEFALEATTDGSTATLGAFSSELAAYLAEAAGESTLYLVTASYTEAE